MGFSDVRRREMEPKPCRDVAPTSTSLDVPDHCDWPQLQLRVNTWSSFVGGGGGEVDTKGVSIGKKLDVLGGEQVRHVR